MRKQLYPQVARSTRACMEHTHGTGGEPGDDRHYVHVQMGTAPTARMTHWPLVMAAFVTTWHMHAECQPVDLLARKPVETMDIGQHCVTMPTHDFVLPELQWPCAPSLQQVPTCTMPPAPVSAWHTFSRSAFGCFDTFERRATTGSGSCSRSKLSKSAPLMTHAGACGQTCAGQYSRSAIGCRRHNQLTTMHGYPWTCSEPSSDSSSACAPLAAAPPSSSFGNAAKPLALRDALQPV